MIFHYFVLVKREKSYFKMYQEEWLQYWRSRAWYSEDLLMRMTSKKRKRQQYRPKKRVFSDLDVDKVLENINTFDDVVRHQVSIMAMVDKSPKLKSLVNILPASRKMSQLIGLEETKKQLFQVLLLGMSNIKSYDHKNIVLLGSPGSCKTTLLNIFAEAYQQAGLAKKETVVFATRTDLVGQYLGSSALRTQETVKRAINGILIIDEVYSLGSKENRDMFCKEAIDTLNQLIDIHKHDLLVVVAGYEKDVRECFFDQNHGLERRFLTWIKMEPYTKSELYSIFVSKCIPFFTMENEPQIHAIFLKFYTQFTNQGGDCTSIVTKMNMLFAKKRWLSIDATLSITANDVQNAIELVIEGRQPKKDTSMLSMYS